MVRLLEMALSGVVLRFVSKASCVVCLLALAGSAGAGALEDGEVVLSLPGALRQVHLARPDESPAPVALRMTLYRIDGQWADQAALDYSRLNSSRANTAVVKPDADGSFSLSFQAGNDPWVKGGAGTVKVTLEAGADKVVTGKFEGTWNGEAVEGEVGGRVWPFFPGIKDKVRSGHPRLLGIDVKELRRRAQTPWGKAWVDWARGILSKDPAPMMKAPYRRDQWAMGHAMLWLIDQKPENLERAKYWMRWCMNDRGGEAGAWCFSMHIEGVAVCFDLLYNDLSEMERAEAVRFLTRDPRLQGYSADRAPGFTGNYGLAFANGALMAKLAVMGEPAVPEMTPTAAAATAIAPLAEGMQQPAGAPLTTLKNWRCPDSWMSVGMFPGVDAAAIVKELKLLEGPLPAAGEERVAGGQTGKASLLGPKNTVQSLSYYPRGANPCLMVNQNWEGMPKSFFMQRAWTVYTTLVSAEDRLMLAQPEYEVATYGVRLWLNDMEVKQNQLINFSKGTYRLTTAVPVIGMQWAAPRFTDFDEAAAKANAQAQNALIKANGGTVPGQSRAFLELLEWMKMELPGYCGENGALVAAHGRNDVWHGLAPAMHALKASTDFPLPCDGVDRIAAWQLHNRGMHFNSDWGADYWPVLGFPALVPDQWRPLQKQIMDEEGPQMAGYLCTAHALWALLSYPEKSEVDAAAIARLPLVLEDKRFGAFSIRQGWTADKSVELVIGGQVKADVEGQYAGNFGFGGLSKSNGLERVIVRGVPGSAGVFTLWSGGTTLEGNRPRIGTLAGRGGGRILHQDVSEKGLLISIDLPEFVPPPGDSGKAYRNAHATGAAVTRHIAVVPGKEGEAMCVVLLDRFRKMGKETPAQVMPPGRGKVEMDGSMWTWTADDGAKLRWTPILGSIDGKSGVLSGGEDLFSVLSVGGGAPAAKLEGTGLETTIKAGDVVVRFDSKANHFVMSKSAGE